MKSFYVSLIILICVISFGTREYAQQTPPQPTDTLPPLPKTYNAGFDVIITYEGKIIYGLVKEVGPLLIKYQRTDIPDGPVYTIPKSEVYAISYRNQVKEYMNVPDGEVIPGSPNPNPNRNPNRNPNPNINGYNNNPYYNGLNNPYNNGYYKRPFVLTQGNVRIGVGFFRGYTKVDNANQYSSSVNFPPIVIAYDGLFRNQVRLGVQVGFGSHKFSKQDYNNYDSVQNNVSLKENIFSLMVYGKYSSTTSYANFRPYVIGGIGINSSNVHNETQVRFLNNASQTLLVTSGSRSVGLGILARIGTDYYLNQKLGVFADIGTGVALLQL